MTDRLTREQVEEWREMLIDPAPWASDSERIAAINSLCDLALSALEGREKGLEEAARICDQYAEQKWNEYKTGTGIGRGNPYWEGQADAADACAYAIRAVALRAPTLPTTAAPTE